MRHVCPKDVKKMLFKKARSAYWKKWAAKHEYEELEEDAWIFQGQVGVCSQDVQNIFLKQSGVVCLKTCAAKQECEELKDGVWPEPVHAMLRRKTNEPSTDKHGHVMRKLFVEGGWVQKTLYDIRCSDWSDEKKCRGCNEEEGGLYFCPSWRGVRDQIPEGFGEMGTQSENVEGRLDVAKRNHVVPTERRQLEQHPLVCPPVGFGKSTNSWSMSAEDFRDLVSTGSYLLGEGCNKEENTEKHRLHHCPCWKEIRSQIPGTLMKWEQRARTSEKDWKWQRRITTHALSEKPIGKEPPNSAKMGVRKAQKLGLPS